MSKEALIKNLRTARFHLDGDLYEAFNAGIDQAIRIVEQHSEWGKIESDFLMKHIFQITDQVTRRVNAEEGGDTDLKGVIRRTLEEASRYLVEASEAS